MIVWGGGPSLEGDGIGPAWAPLLPLKRGEMIPIFDLAYLNGWENRDGPEQWTTEQLLDPVPDLVGGTMTPGTPSASPSSFDGEFVQVPHDDWFERMILLPHRVNAGLVITPKSFTVQLFNSFRRAPKVWEDLQNFTEEGVEWANLPTLPVTIQPLDGYALELDFLTSGPPRITGHFQFGVGAVDLILLLAGQRGIFLLYPPESPLVEKLQFLTDVIERSDGTEQRVSLRAVPRQVFELNLAIEGAARETLNAVLLAAQDTALGIPVWHEAAKLSVAVSQGDDTVTVSSTNWMDFREGDLAVIFASEEDYELLEVQSLTGTTITFTSEFQGSFNTTAIVMPVRRCNVAQEIRGDREAVNIQRAKITASVIDNAIDIGSAAGFSSFEGYPLLDDPNAFDSTLSETLSRKLNVYDNRTGLRTIESPWEIGRRSHSKRFVSNTPERLWEIRQLVHYLRGRGKSFFIPTFYNDLQVTQAVNGGSNTITVQNIGYSKLIQARQPADVLRLVLRDGSSEVRRVVAYEELSDQEEILTLQTNWSIGGSVDEVLRVEYVEKVRFDSDEITLTHIDALGNSHIDVPVKATLA